MKVYEGQIEVCVWNDLYMEFCCFFHSIVDPVIYSLLDVDKANNRITDKD